MDFLLAMALVPAFVLLWYVYKLDPVEKEPGRLLARLFGYGALACLPAIVLESLGGEIFLGGRSAYTIPELLLENFVIIATAEELCKFFFLRWKTWKNPAFDYVFDGIVYAVFVSLGFAALENVGYVYEFGMATAVVRAVTAVPGHAIFGVFMGFFYGLAKRADCMGSKGQKWLFLLAALIVPILGHGFYDFCASIDDGAISMLFWVFLLIIMVVAMRLVKHMAKQAHPIYTQSSTQAPLQANNNSYGAPLDSVPYNPFIDNSFDGGQPTYTAPNQYGNQSRRSETPALPSTHPFSSPNSLGPFSKG